MHFKEGDKLSLLTNFLKLFKYDPVEDKDKTFNITQALNDNWDKIDENVEELSNYIGSLDGLTTIEKENLVAAVNEIDKNVKMHETEIASSLEFYDNFIRATKPFEERFTKIHSTTQSEFDILLDNLHLNGPSESFYKRAISSSASTLPLNGSSALLEGYRTTANYGWQRLTTYGGGIIYIRVKTNTWSDWYQIGTNRPISWIRATLVNGWTGTIEYRRNSLGQLEYRFHNINGTNATSRILTTIAERLRPAEYTRFLLQHSTSGTTGKAVYITPDGTVSSGETNHNDYTSLSGSIIVHE